MERISIYDENGIFQGWFSRDAAIEIASYSGGSPYQSGKILLATAKGKLVVNSWDNSGYDNYRFAMNEVEIAEILARGGYEGDEKKYQEILEKYEI